MARAKKPTTEAVRKTETKRSDGGSWVGTGKPGPGRPKGSKSKRSLALRTWLEQQNARPEQFLAYFMMGRAEEIGLRKKDLTPALRVQAARDLMPFVWPKLSAIDARLVNEEGEDAIARVEVVLVNGNGDGGK